MILMRKYFTGTDDVHAHDYNRPIKELKIREKEGKTNEKTEQKAVLYVPSEKHARQP